MQMEMMELSNSVISMDCQLLVMEESNSALTSRLSLVEGTVKTQERLMHDSFQELKNARAENRNLRNFAIRATSDIEKTRRHAEAERNNMAAKYNKQLQKINKQKQRELVEQSNGLIERFTEEVQSLMTSHKATLEVAQRHADIVKAREMSEQAIKAQQDKESLKQDLCQRHALELQRKYQEYLTTLVAVKTELAGANTKVVQKEHEHALKMKAMQSEVTKRDHVITQLKSEAVTQRASLTQLMARMENQTEDLAQRNAETRRDIRLFLEEQFYGKLNHRLGAVRAEHENKVKELVEQNIDDANKHNTQLAELHTRLREAKDKYENHGSLPHDLDEIDRLRTSLHDGEEKGTRTQPVTDTHQTEADTCHVQLQLMTLHHHQQQQRRRRQQLQQNRRQQQQRQEQLHHQRPQQHIETPIASPAMQSTIPHTTIQTTTEDPAILIDDYIVISDRADASEDYVVIEDDNITDNTGISHARSIHQQVDDSFDSPQDTPEDIQAKTRQPTSTLVDGSGHVYSGYFEKEVGAPIEDVYSDDFIVIPNGADALEDGVVLEVVNRSDDTDTAHASSVQHHTADSLDSSQDTPENLQATSGQTTDTLVDDTDNVYSDFPEMEDSAATEDVNTSNESATFQVSTVQQQTRDSLDCQQESPEDLQTQSSGTTDTSVEQADRLSDSEMVCSEDDHKGEEISETMLDTERYLEYGYSRFPGNLLFSFPIHQDIDKSSSYGNNENLEFPTENISSNEIVDNAKREEETAVNNLNSVSGMKQSQMCEQLDAEGSQNLNQLDSHAINENKWTQPSVTDDSEIIESERDLHRTSEKTLSTFTPTPTAVKNSGSLLSTIPGSKDDSNENFEYITIGTEHATKWDKHREEEEAKPEVDQLMFEITMKALVKENAEETTESMSSAVLDADNDETQYPTSNDTQTTDTMDVCLESHCNSNGVEENLPLTIVLEDKKKNGCFQNDVKEQGTKKTYTEAISDELDRKKYSTANAKDEDSIDDSCSGGKETVDEGKKKKNMPGSGKKMTWKPKPGQNTKKSLNEKPRWRR